ncbi:MAG TPA: PRC-barrel domain-containing protein [Pseudomonadales bacterium]
MAASPSKGTLLALAVAACGAAAHAQQNCQQQIGQLEQQIQEQQINQRRQMEMRELLEAARHDPGECAANLERARRMMREGTQTPTDEPSVATDDETAIVQEDRKLAGRQRPAASDPNLQDVRGRQVLSSDGEEIGEVQGFVRSTTDGSAHALIAVGGVLGVGERTIAVPLERIEIAENGTLRTRLDQQALEAQPEYDEQHFREIPETELAALEAELRTQHEPPPTDQ